MRGHSKIASFDFDGTMETYNGWKGEGVFGRPIAKCLRLIDWARQQGFRIVIHTARPDIDLVKKWCEMYGIKVDDVTNIKPSADLGFDDRVVTFSEGKSVEQMIEEAKHILKEHEEAKGQTRKPRSSPARRRAMVGG